MRSEADVRSMLYTLERFNSAAMRQVEKAICSDADIEDRENNIAAFNNNSLILCALRWVMGESTIEVKDGGTTLEL